MQQSNLYKQYLPQVGQIGGASMYMPINNLGNAIQKHGIIQQQQQLSPQNNENINPYLQDSAYQGQLYEMRKWVIKINNKIKDIKNKQTRDRIYFFS